MLHHLVLGWPVISEMAFDIERARYLKSAPDPESGKHVFVSGLARSGTTALMRAIYQTGGFASVLYADMPFVLCPNSWGRMHRRSGAEALLQERAHGDGILVNVESPEALDEVFWRVFARDEYIKRDGLYPHTPDPDTLQQYAEFIRLVLRRREKTRYLSKSCNGMLRLPAFRRQFPDALFLVPIRQPASHAQSLFSQHQRFVDSDRFTRHYMAWLGHYEFGPAHRPFRWTTEPIRYSDPDSLDYWLEQWTRCYSYLAELVRSDGSDRLLFIPYEDLCEDGGVWGRIAKLLELDTPGYPVFRKSEKPVAQTPDADLAGTAESLYAAIRQSALEKLKVTCG